jgi:hypothetical protein
MPTPTIVAAALIAASLVYGLTVVQVHADASGSGKFVEPPEWCFADQQASEIFAITLVKRRVSKPTKTNEACV